MVVPEGRRTSPLDQLRSGPYTISGPALVRALHRRLATLAAFVHCLEATAQDDALEVLETLMRDLFRGAQAAHRKARLRTLKDLDQAAATLAEACQILLDTHLPETEVRAQVLGVNCSVRLRRAV